MSKSAHTVSQGQALAAQDSRFLTMLGTLPVRIARIPHPTSGRRIRRYARVCVVILDGSPWRDD